MDVSQCIKFHLIFFYLQRYAPGKHNIAKTSKGNNSINNDDRVTALTFCTSPHSPLSVYQVSFVYLQFFQRHVPDKQIIEKKIGRKISL